MRLRIILLAIFIILTGSAYAQEDNIECASSEARQMTLYNPAHLETILGITPVCENGLLHIKTTLDEGRAAREWDIGWLYGNVETREGSKNIVINDGGFIANPESEIKINISGKSFIIDAGEEGRLYFDIIKGIYLENYYFLTCEKEECRMKSLITPHEAYLNVTGEAVMILNAVLENYLKGEPLHEDARIAENLRTTLSDLSKISVENTTWITINAETEGRSKFGNIEAASNERIKLRRYYSSGLNPARDVAGYIDIIFAKDADIFAKENINFGVLSSAGPGEPESIRLHVNNQELIELRQGAILMFSDEGIYERCATGGAGTLILNKGSCGFINTEDGKIRLKPWRIEMDASGRELPFKMSLNLPPSITYMELKEFELDDSLSTITIKKTGKSMLFSRDKFTLSENTNWGDFGISFSAYLYNTETKNYEHFECFYETMTCYLEEEQVFGFTELTASPAVRCRRDSDCSNEKVCRERQCTRPAQCKPMELYGPTVAEPVDIVFISDGYSTEREFLSDVTASIKGDALGHIGMLTMEPFRSNAHKFKFFTIYTGDRIAETEYVPWLMREMPSGRYITKLKKECSSADFVILLSKRDFRSYAPFGGDAFISTTEKPGWLTATVVHEFGHSFGNLKDEYYEPGKGQYVGKPNCLSESQAKRFWGEELANEAISNNWKGCGGPARSEYANYLKPSFNSIMNTQTSPETGGNVFNAPSLAWLREKLDKY